MPLIMFKFTPQAYFSLPLSLLSLYTYTQWYIYIHKLIKTWRCLYLYFIFIIFYIFTQGHFSIAFRYSERDRGRGERETSIQEIHIDWLFPTHTLTRARKNPQPKDVPLMLNPTTTLQCMVWHSNHLATQARAIFLSLYIIFHIIWLLYTLFSKVCLEPIWLGWYYQKTIICKVVRSFKWTLLLKGFFHSYFLVLCLVTFSFHNQLWSHF